MNFRSYLFPALLALLLHSVILSALFYSWLGYAEDKKQLTPRHVKAQIVDLKSQLQAQQREQQAEAKKKADARQRADARKQEALKKEQRKQEAIKQQRLKQAAEEKQQQAREKAAALKQAEAKKKAEAVKQKAAREKAEALRKKQAAEAAKQQAEARRQADAKQAAERQQAEEQRKQRERQAQQQRDAALAAALAAEEQEMQALQDQQATAGYLEYIAAEIENNWRRPPSARNGMTVVLSLHLLPTGEVDNVYVVNGSGDEHFDASAIRAVKRVDRFSELQKMDPILFDRNFRKLTLEYNPSDLRR
ncbi:cell envelope integrity protein TolA [Amphritea sp. 1_MG-2023]|uniref:cell envelope integrity protein TolA n=1 Tax=Amphritea sp. 1_MG-2023 TaxID=3062670 RepID=UPI0026E15864|nr:cell envelope integrity protein TolA [Amphritea sp. 1_MG-2023]MDO6562568.1 cell envelope integrity protein TolA [Amphritea sp. 1_MG-2023]